MSTPSVTTVASSTGHHPVVQKTIESRANDLQARIADAVTRFAGSMRFVYIHAIAFAAWMLLLERSPWQTLTLIVSLEAIFLSTFVMIGQNRQNAFAQAKADHDFRSQEADLGNDLQLTREIHVLATQMHEQLCGDGSGATPGSTTG